MNVLVIINMTGGRRGEGPQVVVAIDEFLAFAAVSPLIRLSCPDFSNGRSTLLVLCAYEVSKERHLVFGAVYGQRLSIGVVNRIRHIVDVGVARKVLRTDIGEP